MAGDYAYIRSERSGMRVVDVSDPARPVEVGVFDEFSDITSIAVAGNYAYLSDSTKGLRVVDVTDPTAPMEVGTYKPATSLFDVAVAGGLYLCTFHRQAYVRQKISGDRRGGPSNPAGGRHL